MSKFLRTVDTNVCKMSQKGKRDSNVSSQDATKEKIWIR